MGDTVHNYIQQWHPEPERNLFLRQMWVRVPCPQAAQPLWLFCRKVRGDVSLSMHLLPGHHFSVSLQAWLACPALTHCQRMACTQQFMFTPWTHAWTHLCSNRSLSLLNASIFICVTSPWFPLNLTSSPLRHPLPVELQQWELTVMKGGGVA